MRKSDGIWSGLVFAAGILLFVDLFFDWRHATISLPLVNVEAGSSGWHGVGVAAGIAVVALLAWEAARLAGGWTPRQLLVSAGLAAITAGCTVAAFLNGADVAVGSVQVQVGGHTWAAWTGLALAAVLVVATLGRLLATVTFHVPRPHAGPA